MDRDDWFERWSQRTGTPDMRALRASGFFHPYTMVVYHGGRFVYVDDKEADVKEYVKEADVMSIMDLDKMCATLGYEHHALYWYVTPGKSIEDGLVKLKGHDDIIRMVKELAGDRKVNVFFEHFRGVNRRKAPGEGSSVPIEEEEVLAKQGGVAVGFEGLGEQEGIGQDFGVEEIEATINTEDIVDEDAWSSDSDSSTDFDDDFEEPKYMETCEDAEVEVQGVIYDEPNGNVEEQNGEPLFNDGEMDDDQMQALRELGRLNRKRKSQRAKTRPNYELYDGVSDFKEVKLEVGQVFASSKVFKEVTKEYAIRCGRVIWFPCNEKGRVKDAFMIKTLNDKHTCPRSNKNRHANSAWLSRRYTNQLRRGGNFKMSHFLSQLRKDYVEQPSRSQVYRAKLKAGEIIEGSLSTQYAKLWDYAEELKKTNPGSTVVIDTELGPDDKNKFKRIYICFNACKQGWLHGCRKIIGLDACHVKAYHKAQLMWAVGIDADNGYYLIAHAVVEKECHESWSWFLNLLKEDLNLTDCLGITFMTD
ncbi:hypothetical protein Dsin_011585 [Dipteronia sinensis]|uniref:PB1-like domain-containing protein n=1 Tax=Dipteronia sinensis TaxID=43782 RepID=A0AAE0EFH1_9ROSI|nr:hypothetical protein Dsin_011585 [Dipteronia sinensis]